MSIELGRYNFDVSAEFLKIVPYFYVTNEDGTEKTTFKAFMEVLAGSLENTQLSLLDLASRIRTFLNTTGQHMSLESLLNDTYDATLRRIVIVENDIGLFATETWFLQSESDPENKIWYLQSEVDPVPKTWYTQPEIADRANFTIQIPAAVTFDETLLRQLLDSYVLAGKTYNIEIV